MESEPVDIVRMIRERERQADSVHSEWRKEARESYDMVAGGGKQWEEESRALLEEAKKPCVEFNRMGAIVDAVSGSEVNNRQEVTFIPRKPGDIQRSGIADLRTAAAHWARDNCDAEDEESDSFGDVLISGVGFTQTRMDYEEEEEGKIVIERVDPLEMSWDPSAKKKNLADARWFTHKCRYTKEELEEKWPDKVDEIAANPSWTPEEDEDSVTINDPKRAYKDGLDHQEGRSGYEVIRHQWYEVESIYKVLDPMSGQIVEMPEDRFQVAQQVMPDIQHAKTPRRIYKQAFICGNVELESGEAPCNCGFTFQPITGKRDRNKRTWYGLVRPMKDPQRWANKFFSQLLHIINTNAKGGLMVETGAVTNTRKFEQNWAKSDGVAWLNPGGIGKIKPKDPPQIPAALGQMMEFAVSSIMDCPGVNLELLGMADRQQAGVLEEKRTRAGLTILAPFFDSLRLYRKRQGRVLSYFIREYISDGRLIRVAGPEGEQFIPLLRSPDDIDYDVVVDDAPTARDTKERTWMTLQPVMQTFMQQGIPVPAEVLDYAPIPATLAAAFKQAYVQHIQKMSQGNPMQAAELANKAADTEQKESAAAKNYTDAGIAGVTALAQLFGPQQPMQQPSTVQ